MSYCYRRHLPHWRCEEGRCAYFVTWRTASNRAALSGPERDLVASALLHFHGIRYELHAFVVMDDHVHVVVTAFEGEPLQRTIHTWKSYTGHLLARGRNGGGGVWQAESFDRVIRSDREFQDDVKYVAHNPWKRWPNLGEYRWVWASGVMGREAGAGGGFTETVP